MEKPKLQRVTYEELLEEISSFIKQKYGGVTAFTKHKDYTRCGFSKEEAVKVVNYLSIPRGGGSKKVQSIPTMKKLYKTLLNEKIEANLVVTRELQIFRMK